MNQLRVLIYHPSKAYLYRDLLVDKAQSLEIELDAAANSEEVSSRLLHADVLLSANSFPIEQLKDATNLQWIHVQGAGVNRWVDAELPMGIRISRTTGSFGPRMAEYAFCYMLVATQHVREVLYNQANHQWVPLQPSVLHGKVLGIAGVGNIGSCVASRGKAFGMRVKGLAHKPKPEVEVEKWYSPDELPTFVEDLDFLVISLPLTPETRGMFRANVFDSMRPSAWLINVARGPIVDEADLVAALQMGKIAGAILDVFDEEPLPPDHLLWSQPNVIVTPHQSGGTCVDEVIEVFEENLHRFRKGVQLLNEVDLQTMY